MERATQERLVGATLLIVAGVILIPWLLDGSMTESGVSEQELVLPGGNDSGNETRRITLDVPAQEAASATPGPREIDSRSVRDVDQPAAAMNLPTPETRETSTSIPPARFAKPMTEQQTPPAAAVDESPDNANEEPPQAAPASAAANTPADPQEAQSAPEVVARAPEPSTAAPASSPPVSAPVEAVPATATANAWAVQVGSFASQENAERLAERLRGKSYKAFVMRNVVDGRVRFRVRVGPVAQRSEADLLATALQEDRQPARVLSHP